MPSDLDPSDDEDEDYKPPSNAEGSESEEEPTAKKPRLESPIVEGRVVAEQQRQEMWEEFQASLADSSRATAKDIEMIEIEKHFKFAGKEITETKVVAANSDEAKQWLASKTNEGISNTSTNHAPLDCNSLTVVEDATKFTPAHPRPGPRRPRVNLLSSKPKKLTMLQKSALDWSTHLADTDKFVKEELDVNRRSGGSLAKHDFLDRVGIRRQEEVEKELGKKRRR